MADLTISLQPETVARIKRDADSRGVSVEAIAVEMIEAWVSVSEIDPQDDLLRLREPGEDVDAKTAFDDLRAKVKAHRV